MLTKAAVLGAAQAPYTVEDIDLPPPGAGEMRVRITAAGICHTDMIFASGAMGSYFPLVLGHEGVGVVDAVGVGVNSVAPGDKVLLTFDSCGQCLNCSRSQPSYCYSFTGLNFACVDPTGTPSSKKPDGTPVATRFFGQSSFASYAIARVRNAIKLPASVDETVLAPLGCAVQTGAGAVLRSLGATKDSRIVVMGGGAVGLSAVMGAKIAGCADIILIEPQAARRELGVALGATHTIDPGAGDTAAAVRAICPEGVENVVDTSGNLGAMQSAIGMLAPRGALGLVGVPASLDAVLPVPLVPLIAAGFRVVGIIEGDSDPATFLPELVAHHAAGRLPIEKLISFYPFAEINTAMSDTHHSKCIKAVLRF